MDEYDLTLLQVYSLRVDDGINVNTFDKLCFIFPHARLGLLKTTEKHIQFLSGFQPVQYDCCPSSCICYTGPFLIIKRFWNVQSANRITTRLMERHPNYILNIFPSSLAFMQWFLILPMHVKCNTSQTINTIQQS